MYKATERLWLTADREHVVPDGHPDAAFLLCVPGNEIPEVEVQRLGLEQRPTTDKDAGDELSTKPRRMASKADWVVYAVANGMDPADVETLKRDELADRFKD